MAWYEKYEDCEIEEESIIRKIKEEMKKEKQAEKQGEWGIWNLIQKLNQNAQC